jgi:hypothetical protein
MNIERPTSNVEWKGGRERHPSSPLATPRHGPSSPPATPRQGNGKRLAEYGVTGNEYRVTSNEQPVTGNEHPVSSIKYPVSIIIP